MKPEDAARWLKHARDTYGDNVALCGAFVLVEGATFNDYCDFLNAALDRYGKENKEEITAALNQRAVI